MPTTFESASDLAAALRHAAEAHDEHDDRTGEPNPDWPDWYAEYLVRSRLARKLEAGRGATGSRLLPNHSVAATSGKVRRDSAHGVHRQARRLHDGAMGTVVLADDDVLLREGLASLLGRSGYEVVGQAGDASELTALVREYVPALVVTDIRMPPTHSFEGLDAARLIRQEFPDIGILVLSAHIEAKHAMGLLAGRSRIGYLLKARVTDVTEFLDTLGRIARGACVIDPSLVQELVTGRADDLLARLSARERQVLTLMAEGRSNAGIARRLVVCESTVEKHVRSILSKLDLEEADDDHRRVLAVIRYLDH